jgi:hypothetical protein
LSHLYIKVIFLPRQARDKHRENSKKARFLEGSGGSIWIQQKTWARELAVAEREAGGTPFEANSTIFNSDGSYR